MHFDYRIGLRIRPLRDEGSGFDALNDLPLQYTAFLKSLHGVLSNDISAVDHE